MQFGFIMPLLKVRIAVKQGMGRVLTHIINEVICFAENFTKAFEEDCGNGLHPQRMDIFCFARKAPILSCKANCWC